MSPKVTKNYNFSIDLFRILSILAVILIHTSTKILDLSNYDLANYSFTLFLNQISRFAVPIFFLISAFVLELNYSSSFNYFPYLKKRLSRLLLPYLFWSLIYYFIVYPHNTKTLITALFLGDASYQLYFVPTLLIFYLIFPLIHNYLKLFTHKFVILLLGIIQIFILALDYYFQPLPFSHPITVFLLNFDLFLLGILASRHQTTILNFVKKYQAIFYLITPILALFITFEGYSRYLQTQNYLSFYSQWRPSIFLYTLSLASLLFYLFNKIKLNITYVKKIASYSFFVFFVHVIFIEIIWKFLPNSLFFHPFISFILVSILSYLLAYLVSKFPYASRLTG